MTFTKSPADALQGVNGHRRGVRLRALWLVPALALLLLLLTRLAPPDTLNASAQLTPPLESAGRLHPSAAVGARTANDVHTSLPGGAVLLEKIELGEARPLSLASADFDEDGVPDLLSGYAQADGGVLSINRGNADSIYPRSPEAALRRADGSYTDAPFLSPSRAFAVGGVPDFIEAGDFDGDGHWDVVAASRGGNVLHLLAGDGLGGLGAARCIELGGTVTALTGGEINRADGLPDVVVAVEGERGAKLLVFEGPEGALRSAPEVFPLPAPGTALALGQFDDEYEKDLAVASGAELLVIQGRDRKLSQDREAQASVRAAAVGRRSFASEIKSLAVGDFIEGPQTDIALLDEGGTVRVLSRGRESWEVGKAFEERAGVRRLSAWHSRSASSGPRPAPLRLLSAYVSGSPKDDLLAVGPSGNQVRVINDPAQRGSPELAEKSPAGRAASLDTGGREVVAAEAELLAVLPMRLDADALSDLVILRKGRPEPAVVLTHGPASPRGAPQDVRTADAAGVDTCPRTPLAVGQTINGVLTTTDCKLRIPTAYDMYSFSGAAGQYVSATVSSGSIDVKVELLAPDGRLMAFDGANEPKRTARVVFGLPVAGTYDIRVGAVALDVTGSYTLALAALPSASQTFVVVNTNDGGPGSLRQALLNANASPGPDTVVFQIGTGLKTIASASPLPELTDVVTIDGTTQPGFAGQPIIELTGAGLVVAGGRSVVRGLVLNRCGSAILIPRNGGNIVEGNYIGTDATGTIFMKDMGFEHVNLSILSADNKVGGTTASARNVISGAFKIGDLATDAVTGNVVQGNYIGTDATGTAPIAAPRDNSNGLTVQGLNTTVGGTTAGARNVISGNVHSGVLIITSVNPDAPGGNLVQGNLIGTDVTGTRALRNTINMPSFGVIEGSNGRNTIGGTTIAARNVISGNPFNSGVTVGNSFGTLIQGNFIGTDITGLRRLGNGGNGFDISSGIENTVGGATAGARNVISGNNREGVLISGRFFPFPVGGGLNTTRNKVQGNYIGTDATGTVSISNRNGVLITIEDDVADNAIGGAAPGTGNLISGNSLHGVAIGLKFNVDDGPELTGGTGILVQGNLIGTDASGLNPLGNFQSGIFVDADSFTNTIADNIVAHNGNNGVHIPANNNPGVNIALDNNRIYSNRGLGIDLGDAGITPNDPGDPDVGANLLQNFPTLTSAAVPASSSRVEPLHAGSITVDGTLNSKPNTAYTVHWYFSNAAQCTSNQADSRPLVTGKVANVRTDAAGNAPFSFPFTFPAGASLGVINCTATDPQGNTSEFSSCMPVIDPTVGPSVKFSATSFGGAEGAGSVSVPVTRVGDTTAPAAVDYVTAGGTASDRSDFTTSVGTLRFAAGEATKNILVILTDDAWPEGSETFTVTLSNATGAALGSPSLTTVTITDNDGGGGQAAPNPLDFAQFFARQHYADFLNRVPDASGLQFWTDNITSCGADARCVEARRANVSAAFYLSIEFQETGYLVYRAHKAAFGNLPGKPVPILLQDFLKDTGRAGDGVVVNTPGWPQKLEENKAAYFAEFVTRPSFTALYPPSLTATQFVDALFVRAAVTPLPAERQAAITSYGAGGPAGRAAALRAVAGAQTLKLSEFNRAFVLMQYFGYLRRNPDDIGFDGRPDPSFTGFNFWLQKLNQFNGNFEHAEMVGAFISSFEYRRRFGLLASVSSFAVADMPVRNELKHFYKSLGARRTRRRKVPKSLRALNLTTPRRK